MIGGCGFLYESMRPLPCFFLVSGRVIKLLTQWQAGITWIQAFDAVIILYDVFERKAGKNQ